MTVEIITTVFIAKPEDLDQAYALYEQRIAQAPAQILAHSAAPLPHDNDFELWSLRTQAVYDRLDSPMDWQLYELNALVEFDMEAVDDDELLVQLFFEDVSDPTAYPGTLIGRFHMKRWHDSENSPGQKWQDPLTYVTVGFFTHPDNLLKEPELLAEFVAAINPIVHGGAPSEID